MGFPLERECLDPRRRASDAPLDAALPPAAAMRSDRRPVGRAGAASRPIPSYVCSGDSGGGIFLNPTRTEADGDVLVANVSDGGRDCRRHNNNNRLDTHRIQTWINDTLR